MYDLYYLGTLLHHFSEKDFPSYYREIEHLFTDAHWEELFNVFVSQEFVFIRDIDHKVLFTLIKD
jgi:hypothetical protein